MSQACWECWDCRRLKPAAVSSSVGILPSSSSRLSSPCRACTHTRTHTTTSDAWLFFFPSVIFSLLLNHVFSMEPAAPRRSRCLRTIWGRRSSLCLISSNKVQSHIFQGHRLTGAYPPLFFLGVLLRCVPYGSSSFPFWSVKKRNSVPSLLNLNSRWQSFFLSLMPKLFNQSSLPLVCLVSATMLIRLLINRRAIKNAEDRDESTARCTQAPCIGDWISV